MCAPVKPRPSRSACTRSVRPSTSSERGSPLTTSFRASGTGGQGGKLVAQVREVRLGVDRRRARESLDRLLGCELPAERVEVVSEPGGELVQLTGLHLRVEIGDRLANGRPDLE